MATPISNERALSLALETSGGGVRVSNRNNWRACSAFYLGYISVQSGIRTLNSEINPSIRDKGGIFFPRHQPSAPALL